MDINRATIVGRLTRDPEVRTTGAGITVTSFGVATNFVWTDASGNRKESVEFHNAVAWRKLGEIVGQYLHKGSRVLVEGRLQTQSWEGQDGVKRYRTEIVADNLIMLDSRPANTGDQAPPPAAAAVEEVINIDEQPAQQKEQEDLSAEPKGQAGATGTPDKGAKEEEISVEDIPF